MTVSIERSHLLTVAMWITLGSVLLTAAARADQPVQTISEPGFRPASEYATEFLDTAAPHAIAVLPTIIRRLDRTAHSFASQQQIVAFLNENRIGSAFERPRRVDLGPLEQRSQWDIFRYGQDSIARQLGPNEHAADYVLVMELVTPDNQTVFGVELYILDQQGRSAFSFLLNSHHTSFVEANLVSTDSSEAARDEMIEKATRVGLTALQAQMAQARECIAINAERVPRTIQRGVLHDFESPLLSVTSRNANPLGFSTFSDGSSTVAISRTDSHPPLSGEKSGNSVLQLNVDVSGWAGFVYLTPDQERQLWAPQNWSAMDGFSFWLYGTGSGVQMFVDILDNRSPCSRNDDAERYTYTFWDDLLGWRLVTVPFKDMARKEIWNDAPNDGLNLTEVHGWGLGMTNTNGERSYFVDDFKLWQSSAASAVKPLDVITHEYFVETRLDGDTSRLEIQADSMTGTVIEKVLALQCACADIATERGYRYYTTNERAQLSGGRSSFHINFYSTPPAGVPIATELLAQGDGTQANLMSAVVDAEEVMKVCSLMDGNR